MYLKSNPALWVAILVIVACLGVAEAQTVPLPVWNVTYDTYTALFIGEDRVVVCTSHCDIDLGYNYLSIYPGAYARIYDVRTGALLKELSGGTYRLSDYSAVWNRIVFFSGNARFGVENPTDTGRLQELLICRLDKRDRSISRGQREELTTIQHRWTTMAIISSLERAMVIRKEGFCYTSSTEQATS
ncbi:MAG: hypothetical protein QW540_04930 [Archaeoglobaceae archaeon]